MKDQRQLRATYIQLLATPSMALHALHSYCKRSTFGCIFIFAFFGGEWFPLNHVHL